MASKNAFVFSQPDLLTSSFSVFFDMKKTGILTDVTIRMDNRIFSAHRIILAGAIPYFRSMFTSKMVESKEKEITLKELDPSALESLINFAYTSQVEITAENVQSLLIASEFLQLTQVRDSCCDFLSKRLDPGNVMHVRALADSLSCLSLVKKADRYIRQNFDDFCKTKEFLGLPFSFLNELIRRDDLRVRSEEGVFEAVMTWVQTEEKRHGSLPELLTGIRMTRLTPEFLIKKASREKLIADSIPCRNLLDEAKHYHLLPKERPFLCSFSTSKRCCNERCGMYVFGCNSSTGLTILKYIPDRGTWDTLLTDKTRGDLTNVLALGYWIYVFRRNNIFERLNLSTLEWTSLARYPYSSSDSKHVAVSCGNRVYALASGNTVHFDSEQNKWVCHPQQILFSDAELVVSLGNNIFIFRSSSDPYGPRGETTMYVPQTGEMRKIREMDELRTKFGCAAFDGKIYACGGIARPNSPYLKSTEVYTPSDGRWRSVSPMITARSNFSLIPYNKKLYAIGGVSTYRGTSDIECYDPVSNKWTLASTLDGQYDFLKAVVVTSTSA